MKAFQLKPDLGELKTIAQSGAWKRIPVMGELFADRITPIEALRALRAASHHVFMLESAEADQRWGRYTFLGFNPSLEITCSDGLLRLRRNVEGNPTIEERQVDHPGDALREILAQYRSPALEDFPPFTGGLVGYFAYDYIKYAEPILKRPDLGHEDFLDMDLMLFEQLIVFDSYRQKILLIDGVSTDDLEGSYRAAKERLSKIRDILLEGNRLPFNALSLEGELKPAFSQERYSEMVKIAQHHIYEGDIFQVVLSNPQRAAAKGNLFDVYRVLRCTNPSPYMFYFTSDDVEIAGASPETLARLQDGVLYTYPLAGTRARGKSAEEDEALERELLEDEKELAEHNMLVDLGRNDLGRVCQIGSVEVETYQGILKFSRVMHIGSTVKGLIRKDKDAIDAIDAILPAGTLSGAPKLKACQIIQDLEGSKRGIYGGAVGYLDFTGNMDTCIAIRLAYKKNDELCVQSGAGIVADSRPAAEFIECQNKARAVIDAVLEAEGGLR